jgi:hypothetical protein
MNTSKSSCQSYDSAAWHPRRSATVLKASRSALDFFHRVKANTLLLRLVSDTAALHLNSAHFQLRPSHDFITKTTIPKLDIPKV